VSLVIAAIGVVLLTAPALVARLRMDPASQVRLACTAASAGIWTLAIGIVLTASPLIMWWHDGADVDAVAARHVSPGGPWAWAAAAILAAAGVTWTVRSLHRSITVRRRAGLPRWAAHAFMRDADAGAEVRVADAATPLAFAVPGRDEHVVVTRGLVERLPADSLRAVLAHEGAHLRLRHDRHLLVLATYQRLWGWLPGVDTAVRAHRDAIERWADADATRARSLPADACTRARTSLCEPISAPPVSRPVRGERAWRVAIAWAALALVVAGGMYATTHTVGDVSAIVASLH
jgi:Zn-dependent protease with chaperone function